MLQRKVKLCLIFLASVRDSTAFFLYWESVLLTAGHIIHLIDTHHILHPRYASDLIHQ